jgi:hypothetical protein
MERSSWVGFIIFTPQAAIDDVQGFRTKRGHCKQERSSARSFMKAVCFTRSSRAHVLSSGIPVVRLLFELLLLKLMPLILASCHG